MKKMTSRWIFMSLIGSAILSANAEMGDRVVASVNGAPILQSQVNLLLKNRKNTPENRESALNQLIDAALIRTTLMKMKNPLSESQFKQILAEEVERQLNFIASQNGLSYGQFIIALTNQGINFTQYRKNIAKEITPQLREQLKIATLRDQVIGGEINGIRQSIQPEKVDKLAKKLEAEAKQKGEDKAVKVKIYQVRHILLTLNPLLNDKEAKAKLSQIRRDILDNKITFSKAALDYSKDYLSGANGGELGYQLPDIYTPVFAKMILTTPQGKISQPFKSTFGWHILEVMGTKERNMTDDFYKQKAFEILMRKKLAKLDENWINLLRKSSNVQIEE